MNKNVKRTLGAVLVSILIVSMTGCSKSLEDSNKSKLVKVSITVSSQTPATIAMHKVFKPQIEKRLKGKYDIQLYDSGILGSEKVTYDYTKSGIIEMCVVGTSMWSETPKMTIPDFPFVFDDIEHARKCYQGGLGEYIREDLEKDQPVKLLSWLPNGARAFSSNKEISNIDDFKGQKLRMPNNPIHVKLAESLGANVVIMDMGEVFTALEQGVVDGQDNPISTLKSEGWYEVQNYVYNTNHIISSLELFMGDEFWGDLSEEEQKVFQEVAKETSDYAWDLYIEQLDADVKFIEENGVTVVNPTEEDLDKRKLAIQPVYDYLDSEYDWAPEARELIDNTK